MSTGKSSQGDQPPHDCELCRTLRGIIRALEPEKYRSGPVLEVAVAIETALAAHRFRVVD